MTDAAPISAFQAGEKYLFAEDLAKRCHVSEETVRGWFCEGPPHKRLAHFRKGRIRFTNEAMWVSFLAANLENPPPFPPRTSILEKDVLARAVILVRGLVHCNVVRVDDRGRVHVEQSKGEDQPTAA